MRTALLSLAAVAALAVSAGTADARPNHWRGGWGGGYRMYNSYARPYYGGYSYARPYYGGYYGSRYYNSYSPGFSLYTPRFGLTIGNGGFYPSYGYGGYGGYGYRGWGW